MLKTATQDSINLAHEKIIRHIGELIVDGGICAPVLAGLASVLERSPYFTHKFHIEVPITRFYSLLDSLRMRCSDELSEGYLSIFGFDLRAKHFDKGSLQCEWFFARCRRFKSGPKISLLVEMPSFRHYAQKMWTKLYWDSGLPIVGYILSGDTADIDTSPVYVALSGHDYGLRMFRKLVSPVPTLVLETVDCYEKEGSATITVNSKLEQAIALQ
jgi:hypothetical protein